MKKQKNGIEELMRWPILPCGQHPAEVSDSPVMHFLAARLATMDRNIQRCRRLTRNQRVGTQNAVDKARWAMQEMREYQRKKDLIQGRIWLAQNPRPRVLVMRSTDGDLSKTDPEFTDFDTSKVRNGEAWLIGSDGKPWAWTQNEPASANERTLVADLDRDCERIRRRELEKAAREQAPAAARGRKVIDGARAGAKATKEWRKKEGKSVVDNIPQLQQERNRLVSEGHSHRDACRIVAEKTGHGREYLRKILKRIPAK